MTAQLQKAMLEDYLDRWQIVADFEADEQRQASYAERWRKLNAILRMAATLGLQIDDPDKQDDVIWERWNRLRDRYSVSLSEFQPMQ